MDAFSAVYFDGLTATRRDVTITLFAEGISIAEAGGPALTFWPFIGLRAPGRPRPNRAVRLTSEMAPEARLVVEDAAFFDRLKAEAPQLFRHPLTRPATWGRIGLIGGLLMASLAAAYYGVPYLARPIAAAIPVEWEQGLGKSVKARLIGRAKQCEDDAGKAALKRLVERLADKLDTPYGFDVTVVKAGMANAFAVPGGHIVVMHKMLRETKTPEELAAIVAHEMGHVTERHPMAGAIRMMGITLIFDMIVGDSSGIMETVATMGGVLIAFSYNRDDERAADAIAIRILNDAKVDPRGLESVFLRLAKKAGDEDKDALDRLTQFFSTHPGLAERARNVKVEAPKDVSPALNPADWRALRKICG
jgi:predicted Zn-dependent protease